MEQKTRSSKASTEGDFLTRKMPFYMIPDKRFYFDNFKLY